MCPGLCTIIGAQGKMLIMETQGNNMTLEEFAKLVRQHDISYGYSDDPGVYRRGRDERNTINEAAKLLDREDVIRIWNAECDRKFLDGSAFYWKY